MPSLLARIPFLMSQTFPPSVGVGNTTGIFIQGAGHGMAWKFYASDTSGITDLAVRLNVVGTVTGHTYRLEVQTNTGSYAGTADAPSGVVLGAATAAFAGPAATGFISLKTLATPTGNLTVGDPYWVVMYNVSGTPDASNYVQSTNTTTTALNRARSRGYNGTNWTTITAQILDPLLIRKHSDGTYRGIPFTGNVANTAATAIYGANRQGISFITGAGLTLGGAVVRCTKTGTPAGFVLSVFEGATLKTQTFITVNETTSNTTMLVPFPTPVTLTAGSTCYLVLANATGTAGTQGSTSGNNYNLSAYPVESAYVSSVLPPGTRFISGTGGANPSLDDPTTFTPVDTHYPILAVLLGDPEVDLVGTQTVNTTYLAIGEL